MSVLCFSIFLIERVVLLVFISLGHAGDDGMEEGESNT